MQMHRWPSMWKDVITMLFAGDYCYAHTAEKQDTSTKIAGNDNIRNDENPRRRETTLSREGQIGEETSNMSHPLNGRKSIPGGHLLLQALTS